jgi:transcriptional regulator with XRE-family HTH domain
VREIKCKFGQRLRALRERMGVSQETLAEKAGLDRTYISSIERGKRNVSLENIARLSTALKVEIKDLFTNG